MDLINTVYQIVYWSEAADEYIPVRSLRLYRDKSVAESVVATLEMHPLDAGTVFCVRQHEIV